jgi:hypothetical protein
MHLFHTKQPYEQDILKGWSDLEPWALNDVNCQGQSIQFWLSCHNFFIYVKMILITQKVNICSLYEKNYVTNGTTRNNFLSFCFVNKLQQTKKNHLIIMKKVIYFFFINFEPLVTPYQSRRLLYINNQLSQ